MNRTKIELKGLLTWCFVLLAFFANSQSATVIVEGKVLDTNKKPIPFATVAIKNSTIGTATDENGKFRLQLKNKAVRTLVVSSMGYEEKSIAINFGAKNSLHLVAKLAKSSFGLNEVFVTGKSKATILREQSYAVEAIEAKDLKNLSVSGTDILGKISGINIRQSGGLGSSLNVSLNGLGSNQVRMFIDGVPMDYFGSSLSLNNISANLIERVEVYKGVVPIHLSADALGGAINIVTHVNSGTFVDASFSMGSFGTYIGSVNSRFRHEKSGFTIDFKSFYNHADNNYKVPINLVNFETGKENEEPTWVERFHDAYTSRMVWFETGFTGTNFADMLMFGLMYSDNYKEVQQAEFATGQAKIPYGEVSTAEDKIIVTGKYKKNGFILPDLSLTSNGVLVFANNLNADTSSFRYDWFGDREFFHQNVGEIENRKSLLNLQINNYLNNTYAEYQMNDQHGIAVGFSINYLRLQGTDELKKQNETQFKNPSTASKNIYSASYSNKLFSNRLKSTVFIKNYRYHLNSTTTDYQGTDQIPVAIDKQFLGYGLAATYQFSKLQLKSSFELATRFPEVIELFGDGLNMVSNPALLPEQSWNYNLGGLLNLAQAGHSLMLSANLFLRDTENYIRANTTGLKTSFVNDQNVISRGIDFASSYAFSDKLQAQLNGTYIQMYSMSDNKRKIPNEPNLFGKLFVSYRFNELFAAHDVLAINATQHYVHPFYYRWEDLASQGKAVVDEQYPTDIEGVYSFQDGRYNVSMGVMNVFDLALYDNFAQRRPGRIFNVKFRLFIK